MWVGLDQVKFTGADDAWQFCARNDIKRSNCQLDNSRAETWTTGVGGATDENQTWCYTGGPIIDHYQRWQGYYSGYPDHGQTRNCEGYQNNLFPQPIISSFYCRLWLLLDQFEDETGARIDPTAFLASEEQVTVDECSGYQITHEDAGHLDECGSGTITRTWTVTENCSRLYSRWSGIRK